MWLSTVRGCPVIGGNSLPATKLALDDNIVPYLFVRIAWVDLLDEGESSAATVVAKPRSVVGVESLVVSFHTRVDPKPPKARAVLPNTPGSVVWAELAWSITSSQSPWAIRDP